MQPCASTLHPCGRFGIVKKPGSLRKEWSRQPMHQKCITRSHELQVKEDVTHRGKGSQRRFVPHERRSERERDTHTPLTAVTPLVTVKHTITTRDKRTTNSPPSTIHIQRSGLTPRLDDLQPVTKNPKASSDPLGQGILTRTSRPSLTLCRTTELPRSHLPFPSPHDPATLGTGFQSGN